MYVFVKDMSVQSGYVCQNRSCAGIFGTQRCGRLHWPSVAYILYGARGVVPQNKQPVAPTAHALKRMAIEPIVDLGHAWSIVELTARLVIGRLACPIIPVVEPCHSSRHVHSLFLNRHAVESTLC